MGQRKRLLQAKRRRDRRDTQVLHQLRIKEVPMTASQAAVRERAAAIARTPCAIRAVLAANADPEVLERFDKYLDLAYSECLPAHDSRPLEAFVGRWWWEAVQWSDPESHRAFLAYAERLRRDGPPPESECLSREQIREKYGV